MNLHPNSELSAKLQPDKQRHIQTFAALERLRSGGLTLDRPGDGTTHSNNINTIGRSYREGVHGAVARRICPLAVDTFDGAVEVVGD